MRWLKDVIVSSLLFFLVTISYAEQNAADIAGSMHSQYRDKAGSEKAIKQNFVNPLLGGDKLFTIDSSKSGDVQLVCPSSKEFLTVLVKPKGTGDFDADIYWDSDMDGKMDKSMAVSNVSGICTNGFISCQPGTWVNCKNYSFEYNNGNLQLQEVGLTSLAGCFCINQSCGNNLLWNNVGYVLKVFGGAVAGAFQKADSRYAISDARIDGAAIYFYGQKTRDCGIASGGSGALYPEQYWKSPYTISSSVEGLVLSQSQDSSSFYSLMHSAYNQSQSISNLRSCTIRRNLREQRIGIYDIIEPVGGNGGTVRSCGEKCIQVVLGWEGDNYWCAGCSIFETYYDLLIKRPDLIEKATLIRAKWDDWIQVWFNNYLVWNGPYGNWTDPNSYPPSSCELSTSWDWGLNIDVTNYFKQYGQPHTLRTRNRVAVAGCGEGFSIANIYTNTTCELLQNIESTCDDYENNQNCVLWEETIDNVQTIRQGVRTGLVPLKQPVTACDKTYVFDWLLKSRVYLCKDQGIDLSGAKQRLATVVPSSQYSSDRITFTDIRKEGNTWNTYVNQQFIVGGGATGESCEKACRVKVNRPNVGVGISGRVTEVNTGNINCIYYYRPCYNDICPAQEGETIDIPCQCMNDFGAASTLMQTMRIAGQDMICTSGNIKTLPGY
ncbi:hypothetical protein QI155_10725 [Thermodesulfovibrio sp. 1176]|uniref:hypothetical protein n=1 Tax=Thermodesulfovibrio sp. 1176 TaxID=3043424 RepID=UPI00248256AB|nr:hypothetical protein [Thermodesulfovibrio sp. 1176]MDI1473005.1 hypothetical protein [Thermodesulfovibrio sp. 1176]